MYPQKLLARKSYLLHCQNSKLCVRLMSDNEEESACLPIPYPSLFLSCTSCVFEPTFVSAWDCWRELAMLQVRKNYSGPVGYGRPPSVPHSCCALVRNLGFSTITNGPSCSFYYKWSISKESAWSMQTPMLSETNLTRRAQRGPPFVLVVVTQ